MPTDITINIAGIEETIAMLRDTPKAIAKSTFAKALIAASVPIVEALRARTPVAEYPAGIFSDPGSLADHVVTDVAVLDDGTGGKASIGFGKYGVVANFVEYGHRMIGHENSHQGIQFGDVPPHPFMRPAVEASAEAAIDAFAESVRQSLQKGIPGLPKAS